jgi:L-lysine exporter family protein LysE/ArgO
LLIFANDKYKLKALFLTGLLLSFTLCLDLGIVNVYLVKTGIEKGGKPSFIAGLGSSVGDVIYAVLAVIGIGFLIQFEIVRWVLWIGGTMALVFLAIHMIRRATRDKKSLPVARGKIKGSSGEFINGLVLALSSPSSIIWFTTVGGAIIATTEMSSQTDIYWFIGGFFSASVIWSLSIALFSHYTGSLLGHKLIRILSVISAVIFSLLAVKVGMNGYVYFIK